MPLWVLPFNLSTDEFVRVKVGRPAGPKCSSTHTRRFPVIISSDVLQSLAARPLHMSAHYYGSPHSVVWRHPGSGICLRKWGNLFIHLFMTLTLVYPQGGQQHGIGWQTEAIPARKRGIKSSNGQTHGNLEVKLQESIFPSFMLEHRLLPSGHALLDTFQASSEADREALVSLWK